MTLKKGEVPAAEDTSPLVLDGSSYDVEKLLKGAEATGKTRQQIIQEADNLPDFQTGGAFRSALPEGHNPEPKDAEGDELPADEAALRAELGVEDTRVRAEVEAEPVAPEGDAKSKSSRSR